MFDWTIKKLEGPIEYWHIMTGEQAQLGMDGGLIKRQGREPEEETIINGYVCIIDVTEMDEYLKQIQKHGGRMAIEKRFIPKIGWLAYCFDTEKNLFGNCSLI